MELGTTTKDSLYENDTVEGNGHSADIYNGDGIQLRSAGAVVRKCTITDNEFLHHEHRHLRVLGVPPVT